MGLYLRHVLPYSDGAVYLVDGDGHVIASNGAAASTSPPPHTRAAGHGQVTDASGRRVQFSTVAVGGTPWRLVLTVPPSTLFQTVGTTARVLAWVYLAAFAADADEGGEVRRDTVFAKIRYGLASDAHELRYQLLSVASLEGSMAGQSGEQART